ncbi:hypothetical protein SRB5_53800 [Streptomyces sp. RB5]|uniref:High-affinity nickel-transporter n=1 Tax=Streptomyces smaragdinus TaxID=2585196 RepID=A0A7K0CP71_9ACTN|nr:High-affinity nickel-transporter [Streptomyces smaragdinus]MQY15201.1 hypothetical protein [Streptomyces smaragdinus]
MKRASLVTAVAVLCLGAAAPAVQAHPLGNFSVNHYDGLVLTPDGIEDRLVVDTAEIPTAQDEGATDTDRDGRISRTEAAERAAARCAEQASRTRVTVGGRRLPWRSTRSGLTYTKGEAGLPVARLACTLHADARLGEPAYVSFASAADPDRTGWKEITAVGQDGVRLAESSVRADSETGGLQDYPVIARSRPRHTVTAELRTEPGAGPQAADARQHKAAPGEPEFLPALEHRLTALTTGRDLTLPVGLLAILLTVLLGAGHAALPGHAKLAVAACLARRERGVRAAVAVGATVTVTHTVGVLATGLILTASAGFAGERLLGWLGLASGALIAVVGTGLVFSAVRTLRSGKKHAHDHHGHSHTHTHDTPRKGVLPLLGVGLAGSLVPSPSALVVLLGAVALSRTAFGVLLVIGYGLGMAATLTGAGLLLSGGGSRLAQLGERRLPALKRVTPYGSLLTAVAVLAVGLGLTLRALST